MAHSYQGSIALRFAQVALSLFVCATPTTAGEVQQRVETRHYSIPGTSAHELISRMSHSELTGRLGPGAAAGIVPRYDLAVTTASRQNGCHISGARLNLTFLITLPVARDEARMSKQVRNAWREFVAFASAHEQEHRRIYLACAREFVAKATQIPADRSCRRAEKEAERLLRASRAACEAQQNELDARDYLKVHGLGLFQLAYEGQ